MNNIDAAHRSHTGVTGIASGFVDLDEKTTGFQNSDLIIVAGRPSMGKTAFCLTCTRNAAIDAKIGVGVFSLEMPSYQLTHRLICAEARVDSQKVRQGRLPREEFPKIALAVSRLSEAPIYIDDTPALSVTEIRAKARRLYVEKKVGMFVVDYLQLVRGPRSENKTVEIGEISRSLKALAKELDVPVIALSQLSRAVEQRGGDRRPILSDLRESGAIEQDADMVLFIYRPEVYDIAGQEGESEIIIGKQRNGPIGTVRVMFLKDYVMFANLAKGRGYGQSPADNRAGRESDREYLPF